MTFFGFFKGLPTRKASKAVKTLCKKSFDIAKNLEYDGYQIGLSSITYKFLDKKSAALGANKSASNKRTEINSENQKLVSKQANYQKS